MVLGYLISPVVQIVDNHGKPIVGAKIYVYKAGTTNTVNTYRDFSNHYNPTPVLTNTLGNCTIIAPDDMIYDIVVKDNRNNLLMSKDNLTVSSGINPDINLRFREGYGIIIRKNGNTVTIAIDTDVVATKDDLAAKQDKLTAGDNIDITNNNIINVVNRKTLYTQWPLKVDRGSSMVKLYLDQDFVDKADSNTEILPGADLISYIDASGKQVIGVDTTSSATGDYNFYAGYNNKINGNYNAVFGNSNSATCNDSCVIGNQNYIQDIESSIIAGYNNKAYGISELDNGSINDIIGTNNTVSGKNNYVIGDSNTISGHDIYAFGHSITASNTSTEGDIYAIGKNLNNPTPGWLTMGMGGPAKIEVAYGGTYLNGSVAVLDTISQSNSYLQNYWSNIAFGLNDSKLVAQRHDYQDQSDILSELVINGRGSYTQDVDLTLYNKTDGKKYSLLKLCRALDAAGYDIIV